VSDARASAGRGDLKPDVFETLLCRLDADRDHAGEKYEALRRKLIAFFRWNDCFAGENLADETFDRVAGRLGRGEVHDVVPFVWGVAKNIVRETRRRPQFVAIDALPPGKEPRTEPVELQLLDEREQAARLGCLRRCIEGLSDADRELFLGYEYYAARGRKTQQLAERLRLRVGTLQTRAHRIKRRLEDCAFKCRQAGAARGRQIHGADDADDQ
jgi:DNA-directed RNA polymerase specialized sigma24 family protein